MQLLIVEDNPSTLKMLAFLLRNEGYEVHAVSNANEGLELLHNEPIDLVVLDVMLPDVSGLQICRRIRDEGITIPVLVISALGRRDDKLAALSEGADDYMTKPFDPSEVIARVHSLIRRTQPTLGPQLQTMLCVGNICLDALNQSMVVRGHNPPRNVELTKMESQLLHVLMRNAGNVVSHERLISEAWGTDYEGSSNQLEVYVHRLRTKLRKEVPGIELIKTIQGSGYEFVAPEEERRKTNDES
jgi:DNA-binding response OmpR family regulator